MLHPYRGLREKPIALHKNPSIIRPLKAVAMAAAFAFYAINLPIPFIFS
jgi:hypothetical protein